MGQRITKAALAALWFMVLTFPLVGLKINTVSKSLDLRWDRTMVVGLGTFVLALLWHWCFERKAMGQPIIPLPREARRVVAAFSLPAPVRRALPLAIGVGLLVMPWLSSIYQTNIMISALLYVMLALGLNIVVGLAGQLVLGYAAFYAVGAYTYGLLYQYFGLGFWICLPVGGFMAVMAGLLLGLPVLGLRGDYLAIVTLGFGEIVRLLLQNLSSVTGGPRGISNIARPGLFGMEMGIEGSTIYIYYLVLAAVGVTIIMVTRLKDSRVGLALRALKEDEIASTAMGIDTTRVKLSAFALCSCWAGFAGVIFAAKTTYINPASFTFMESAMMLSMVVLGGMGSIWGVAAAAMLLILVPEYLRAFADYRMILFGATMVLMMIFRPQGLVSGEKRSYRVPSEVEEKGGAA